MARSTRKPATPARPSRPAIAPGTADRVEWVLGAVSMAMIAALLGYLAYDALASGGGDPVLSVEAYAPRPSGTGYLVPFSLRNDGRSTAAAVTVEGILGEGGAAETSTVVLDYAPAGSSTEGGLLFSVDPEGRPFAIRATGYANP